MYENKGTSQLAYIFHFLFVFSRDLMDDITMHCIAVNIGFGLKFTIPNQTGHFSEQDEHFYCNFA